MSMPEGELARARSTQDRPDFLNRQVTNRTARLRLPALIAGVGAASATGLLAAGCKVGESPRREPSTLLTDIVTGIRNFETQWGDKPLTPELAKTYIPMVASLFIVTSNTETIDPNDLASRTFLLTHVPTDAEEAAMKKRHIGDVIDVDADPFVQQFRKDYPGDAEAFTADDYKAIAKNDGAAGFSLEPKAVFATLYRMNRHTAEGLKTNPTLTPSEQWQNYGDINALQQTPTAPIISLRSTLLHEWTHLTSGDESVALSDAFIRVQQGIYNRVNHNFGPQALAFVSGDNNNFDFYFNQAEGMGNPVWDSGLKEFVTDYLAFAKSVKNGLSYQTWGYGSAHDYVNFDRVLKQAGVSDEELEVLYQESRLEDFFMKIADGARGKTFGSVEDKISFSTDLLLSQYWDPTARINRTDAGGRALDKRVGPYWDKFKPYFPEVDVTLPVYARVGDSV